MSMKKLVAFTLVLAAVLPRMAGAETYYLLGVDSGSSVTGENGCSGWGLTSDGARVVSAMTDGNDYVVTADPNTGKARVLRLPTVSNGQTVTIPGDSLTFVKGTMLFPGDGSKATMTNFIVAANGLLSYKNGGQCQQTLSGRLAIGDGGRFENLVDSKQSHTGAAKTSVIALTVTGGATCTMAFGSQGDASKNNTIQLAGDFSGFKGRYVISNAWSDVQFVSQQAVPCALDETAADSILIKDAQVTFADTLTVPATRGVRVEGESVMICIGEGKTATIAGPLSGSTPIVMHGAGTLVLTDESSSYTGTITYKMGHVVIPDALKGQITVVEDLGDFVRTDRWRTFAANVKMSQIVGFSATMRGAKMATAVATEQLHPLVLHTEENGEIVTDYLLQFAADSGDYYKVVQLAFREAGGDVVARRLWRDYVASADKATDLTFQYGLNLPANPKDADLLANPSFREKLALTEEELDGSVCGIADWSVTRGKRENAVFGSAQLLSQCEPLAYDKAYFFSDTLTLARIKEIADDGKLYGMMTGSKFSHKELHPCTAMYPVLETNGGRQELIVQFQVVDLHGTGTDQNDYVKGVVMKFFADAKNPKIVRCQRVWRDYHIYAETANKGSKKGPVGTYNFYTETANGHFADAGYDVYRIYALEPFAFKVPGLIMFIR